MILAVKSDDTILIIYFYGLIGPAELGVLDLEVEIRVKLLVVSSFTILE